MKSALLNLKTPLTGLCLVSNSLTDQMFKLILEGLLEVESLASLTYGKNEMGELSLNSLLNILPHLKELKLNNVKTNAKVLNKLIFEMSQETNNLQTLTLSE